MGAHDHDAGAGRPDPSLIDALTRMCQRGQARSAEELAARQPEPLASLALAAVAAARGDRAGARAHAERAQALAPNSGAASEALAVAHALGGEHDLALDRAREAARLDPSPRAEGGLARMLLGLGRVDEAVSIFEMLASRGDADAHLQLAQLTRGRPDQVALDHYVRAFLLEPSEPATLQALMEDFRASAWPLGVALLAMSVRASAGSPGLRFVADLVNLAARLYVRNTPLEPLVEPSALPFSSARESAATMPVEAQCVLAGMLIDHGRVPEAKSLLTTLRGLASTPRERARVAFAEGRLAQLEGSPQVAATRYEAALEAEPRLLDAACNLVDALLASYGPEADAKISAVVSGLPEIARREHLAFTFNEAVWRELRGELEAAAELVAFLREAPLGPLDAPTRVMEARLRERLSGESRASQGRRRVR